MAVFIVTLELTGDDKQYRALASALKRYDHCQPQRRVWFLDTDARASDVREALRQHVSPRDGIVVAQLKPQAAMMGERCRD